jgi:hypothetical protein
MGRRQWYTLLNLNIVQTEVEQLYATIRETCRKKLWQSRANVPEPEVRSTPYLRRGIFPRSIAEGRQRSALPEWGERLLRYHGVGGFGRHLRFRCLLFN